LCLKEAGAIKGKKGYIELANRTNGCYFTTRKLKEINAERADLMKQYEKKQSTLAKEVVSIAGERIPTEGHLRVADLGA
jgi:DNA mismatch repair protein MSH2